MEKSKFDKWVFFFRAISITLGIVFLYQIYQFYPSLITLIRYHNYELASIGFWLFLASTFTAAMFFAVFFSLKKRNKPTLFLVLSLPISFPLLKLLEIPISRYSSNYIERGISEFSLDIRQQLVDAMKIIYMKAEKAAVFWAIVGFILLSMNAFIFWKNRNEFMN